MFLSLQISVIFNRSLTLEDILFILAFICGLNKLALPQMQKKTSYLD